MAPIRTRTRARGARRAAPYRKPVRKSKPTLQKVMRLIKSQKPEVKIAKYTGSAAFNGSEIKSWNLAYHLFTQGVGEGSFIGKKLHIRGMEIKWQLNNTAVTSTTSGHTYLDHMNLLSVLSTKVYRTTTNLSIDEIQDTALAPNGPYRMNYDSDKVKIMAHRKVRFTPKLAYGSSNPSGGLGGAPQQRTGKIYIRLNKTITFRDWSTSYELKDLNYYLLLQTANFGDSASLIKSGDLFFSVKCYYTDD